jgi:hypothetical protein
VNRLAGRIEQEAHDIKRAQLVFENGAPAFEGEFPETQAAVQRILVGSLHIGTPTVLDGCYVLFALLGQFSQRPRRPRSFVLCHIETFRWLR